MCSSFPLVLSSLCVGWVETVIWSRSRASQNWTARNDDKNWTELNWMKFTGEETVGIVRERLEHAQQHMKERERTLSLERESALLSFLRDAEQCQCRSLSLPLPLSLIIHSNRWETTRTFGEQNFKVFHCFWLWIYMHIYYFSTICYINFYTHFTYMYVMTCHSDLILKMCKN